MGKLLLGLIIALVFNLWAQGNLEIQGKCIKENKNFIYLESKITKMKYKLSKKELTPESLPEISKNCKKDEDPELTLFVPPKSIKNQETFAPKAEES